MAIDHRDLRPLAELTARRVADAINVADPAVQATWYIDPTAGSDAGAGDSAAAALRTWAEFVRRVGVAPYIKSRVDVYLLGNIPVADPVFLRPIVQGSGMLFIHGTKTLVTAGVLTAVTARVVATNTPLSGADTTTPTVWAAHVGRLVEITASGTPARVGAAWWVAKDLGANTARFSTAVTQVVETGTAPSSTEVTPGVGDVFAVYTLSKIGILDILATHGTSLVTLTSRVIVEYANVVDDTAALKQSQLGATTYSTTRVSASRCLFSYRMFATNVSLQNCWYDTAAIAVFGNSTSASNGSAIMAAGGCAASSVQGIFGRLQLQSGALFQGTASITVVSKQGTLEIQDGGFMDWTAGPAISIRAEGVVYLGVVNGGVGRLWGTSAVAGTYAVQIHSGKLVLGTAGGTAPTLAGALTATQDFRVRGLVAGPAFDTTTNAWTSVGTNRNYTWANLALAVAASGFGGNAMDPTSGWGVFTEIV